LVSLQNVEDTDEMFDDLFNKYGKVVFRSNDNKPPTAEVDDDAESLSCKFITFIFKIMVIAYVSRKDSNYLSAPSFPATHVHFG
jgi:hypothetical protein